MARRQPASSVNGELRSVCDGVVAIGTTVKRDSRWHAIATGGRAVGDFDSEREARGALVEHHRKGLANG